MRNYRWALLSAMTMPLLAPSLLAPSLLALPLMTLPASTGRAGPCPSETAAAAAAKAALGPSARQSVAAQMHRQPTVASVAAAEKKVATGGASLPDCRGGEARGGSGYGDRESK
jgi:hypothetical protein